MQNILFGSSGSFFIILFFILVGFLIFRELVTWYFKLNKIVDLLENINNKISFNDSKFEDKKIDNQDYTDPLWMFKKKKVLDK